MIDDSWEINRIQRQDILNCKGDSIIGLINVENKLYPCERIFRISAFECYEGKVNEQLKLKQCSKRMCLNEVLFIDKHLDPKRSLKYRNPLVNWADDRQCYYQKELYRRLINDEITSLFRE